MYTADAKFEAGPARVYSRPPSPVRRVLAAEGACCTGEIGTGRYFGDTNGDCVFDIKDVRRISVILLLVGAGVIPTRVGATSLCPWQQSQLDPTRDGAFKQNDAVYLLSVLAKRRVGI